MRERELLKQVYKAFIRFDDAINSDPLIVEDIDVAYANLDAVMSHIYDVISDELGIDKLPPLEKLGE